MNVDDAYLQRAQMSQNSVFLAKLAFLHCVYATCSAKAPGQRECDDAINQMNQFVNAIDQAMLASISSTLQPRTDSTLEVRLSWVSVYCCAFAFHGSLFWYM